MTYANPTWQAYNSALTKITDEGRAIGPLIAINCGHFIQKDGPKFVSDELTSLLDRGHRGPIYALSRRGLLSRLHLSTQGGALPAPWIFEEPPGGTSLATLMRHLRATCKEAEAQGRGWRVVIDGLRPHTQRLWREMSLQDRARFLRHLRPWWDVHRHRTAPQTLERIQRASDDGQLRLLAGPRDIALGLSAGGDCAAVREGLAAARELGLLTVALTGGRAVAEADHVLAVRSGDPLIVKEVHMTLYHVLWELVHVFYELEAAR